MSIYDEKNLGFKFNFSLKQLKFPILMIVLLILIVCFAWLFSIAFQQKALVLKLNPNPLNLADLSNNGYTTLTVKALNLTGKTAENALIEVKPLSSKNLIVFPEKAVIPTLGTRETKEATFIIRPNPAEKIFAGDYEINVSMKINAQIYNESAILTLKTE